MKSDRQNRSNLICQLLIITLFTLLSAGTIQAAHILGYWGTGDYVDVAVSAEIAVCAAEGSGIDIFNIRNPNEPQLVSNFDTDGQVQSVFIYGYRAYISDQGVGLKIIDVSTSPASLLGTYCEKDADRWPNNVHVTGNTAYVVYDKNGLKIIDVTHPQTPSLLGTYNTAGKATDLFVVGTTACIVVEDTGLDIVDVSNPATPLLLKRIENINATGIWVEGNIACFCVGTSGFILYDITDPRNPQLKGRLNASGSAEINRAQIVGKQLYITYKCNDDDHGLRIVDIADLNNPTLSSSYETSGVARNLVICRGVAFIACESGGLELINVWDPKKPTFAGRYDHSGGARSVWVSGSTAYLAKGNGHLQVIDIKNPQSPTRIAHFDQYADCVRANGSNVYFGGHRTLSAIIIDHTGVADLGHCRTGSYVQGLDIYADHAYITGAAGLQSVDISRITPEIPARYSKFTPRAGTYAQGIQVVDTTAYVCFDDLGLYIVDISHPEAPKELGFYNTPGNATDVAVVGTIAYVADGTGGLQIINVNDPKKTVLLGKLEDLRPKDIREPHASSIKVLGTNAYVTIYSDNGMVGALQIIDISDPSKPKITETIEISGKPVDLMIVGTSAFVADSLSGRMIIIYLGESDHHNLYFPHAACNMGWTTEIALINSSASDITGILYAYDSKGVQLGTMEISLNPHGRRAVTVNYAFANSARINYLVFKSKSKELVGYTKFQHNASGYRVALPTVAEVNDSTFYVSHIASNANWWTGIALLNTTINDKTLTITFSDGQSKSIDLAANEHKSFSIRDLFSNTPQPQIGSAVITDSLLVGGFGQNCTGVVGFELFGALGGLCQLSGITLSGKTANTIYYPHIATDQSWWTGIAAYDPSGANRKLTITPYAANGDASDSIEVDFLPGTKKYLASVGSMGLPEGIAWLQVDADSEISGFELFGNNSNYWLAGYTGVGLESKKGIFAKLDQGSGFGLEVRQSSSAWTGIALVNSEPESATVLFIARDDNGTEIASIETSLDSHKRLMGLAESLFNEQDISGASYISYESNRKLIGFQINGDGQLLDALPVLKY